MQNDIAEYVRGCVVCQRNKDVLRKPGGKLVPLPIPGEAWEFVMADLITQLPMTKNGNTAIFVVVDKLTKMTHFSACSTEIFS